jgi:hypothetical protein
MEMRDEMNHDRDNLDPLAGLDFGPDGETMPDEDPAFDAWIAKVAPTLNAPRIAAPRLEMWAEVQKARKSSVATPRRRTPWIFLSAIAAALLLGVAIDRYALQGADPASPTVAAVPETPTSSPDPARLYRMAAAQTLTQAEALLTAFRASAPQQSAVDMRQLGTWGRQVLGSTRPLIDSPAGQDPQLRALLDDLELVLVQLIQLSGGELNATDRALVEGALEHSDLLPRIRNAVPAGTSGADAASGV